MRQDEDSFTDAEFIDDPVKYASALGMELYGRLGQLAFTELELSYLTSCFRRKVYNDNDQIRLRRHVLLYWENSYFKSTILKDFSKHCCGGEELRRSYRTYDRIYYIPLSGDIRRPILRGSINQIAGKGGRVIAKIVLPLIKYSDLWIADELLDFIGETGNEMIEYMLTLLESGEGKVAQVGMVGANLSESDKKKLRYHGIIFDADMGMMSYEGKGTFWGGTRPIVSQDKRLLNRLWKSGFLNRFVIVPWEPAIGEKEEMFLIKRPPRPAQKQYLYRNNRHFWNIQFEKVDTPPPQLWEEMTSYTRNEFIRNASKFGVNYFPNPRDALHCVQLLTVAALIDTVTEAENTFKRDKARIKKYKSLQYRPSFVIPWAKKYITQYAENKCVFLSQIHKSVESDDSVSYSSVLLGLTEGRTLPVSLVFSHMLAKTIKDFKVSKRHARRILLDMEKCKMIKVKGSGRNRMVNVLRLK